MGDYRIQDLTLDELQRPVLRSVMLSMALTGEYTTRDGRDFYSHEDYDEAMAALFELCRRAKEKD